MPGGQGGGGGWARLTAGEASSISGRNANTTADKALCCSQAFIAHLLSVAFCVEILRFVQCPGARFSADGGDHGDDGVLGFRACPDPRGFLVAIHGELYAAAPTDSATMSGWACRRRESASWGICL
jgi:hypothetical protein